jgi:hypothetical protein
MKNCSHCKKEFPLLDFVIDRKSRDGRGYVCKSCRIVRDSKYVADNKEKIAKSKKAYHQTPKGKENLRKNSSTPKARETQKRGRIANKDKYSIYIEKYRLENKEQIKKTSREYYKNRSRKDPSFRVANNLRHRLWGILKDPSRKVGSHVRDLGCSVEGLITYLESMFYPNSLTGEIMSWDNYGNGPGKWEIDHKEALCLFDLTNRDQLLIACHYTNLQPLWHHDHVAKTIKDLEKRCTA